MNRSISGSRALALALALGGAGLAGAPASAQTYWAPPRGPELLMHPQYDREQPVAPVFEGWYQNADGTYTLSFGFFNHNAEEGLEIPVGEKNFIQPAQYNGGQPTSFPTGKPAFSVGRGFGVFAITVPADFRPTDQVVWTLISKDRVYSVPAGIARHEYQLTPVDKPVGNGSMPPRVKFEPNGPEGIGPAGVMARQTLQAQVGVPVPVTVWAADNFAEGRRQPVPIDLKWTKYQGPAEGSVTFGSDPLRAPAAGGNAQTTAIFSAPGEYVLRVEAGSFSARDSSNSNQCCWTNGYVRVNVVPAPRPRE